jgi:uncharacterized protein YukE
MFRVQPAALTASTRALGDVAEVSKALDASRGEITEQLSHSGSDALSRSTEAFLDAWSGGLRSVSARVSRLGSQLHQASTEYAHAEQRLQGHLGNGADGGPAR